MTVYHVLMLTFGVGVVVYSVWVMWHMVADEIRRTIKGDVTREVWMRAEDPRRRLVDVRPGVAVRPDKTDGWDQQ